MPAVIPCQLNTDLEAQILQYAETLKTDAHLLGAHGLTEAEFYQSGILEGAIQRIRGQLSATTPLIQLRPRPDDTGPVDDDAPVVDRVFDQRFPVQREERHQLALDLRMGQQAFQ